jgi:hypothetical protein
MRGKLQKLLMMAKNTHILDNARELHGKQKTHMQKKDEK